jgi:predicted DNA-binding transcriptional regulator AlpA
MIQIPNYSDDALLTLKETAELLNLKPDTLYHWSMRNKFNDLQRVKIGGKVYFKYASIKKKFYE